MYSANEKAQLIAINTVAGTAPNSWVWVSKEYSSQPIAVTVDGTVAHSIPPEEWTEIAPEPANILKAMVTANHLENLMIIVDGTA